MKKSEGAQGIVQFIKFGVVGVSNTLVDWAVFYLLTNFIFGSGSGELVSKAIAFAVAVINSFIWNSAWTFKKEFRDSIGGKEERIKRGGVVFVRFVLVSLIGWGINYYTFKYVRFNLDQVQIVSLIAASATATLWNFIINKVWTYKR
jgi:putative flippase GtrA